MLSRFDRIPERDKRMDRRMDRQNSYINMAHQHCCADAQSYIDWASWN